MHSKSILLKAVSFFILVVFVFSGCRGGSLSGINVLGPALRPAFNNLSEINRKRGISLSLIGGSALMYGQGVYNLTKKEDCPSDDPQTTSKNESTECKKDAEVTRTWGKIGIVLGVLLFTWGVAIYPDSDEKRSNKKDKITSVVPTQKVYFGIIPDIDNNKLSPKPVVAYKLRF